MPRMRRSAGLVACLVSVVACRSALAVPPAPVPGYPIGSQVKLTGQDLEQAKAAGFEHAEVGLRDLVALPDAEFEAVLARVKKVGLPVRAAIGFLPADMMVVGPKVNKDAQQEYLARAFGRAERLGLATVVFGSASSRRYPPGFSADEAKKQLVDFGRRSGAEAAKHHVVIGIEPLGTEDTNTVNTVPEAVALVRAVGHPGFRLVVDYYHLRLSHEAPEVILQARGVLQHVRIANPTGRAFPLAASESDYASFFGALARIGYRGGIGVETRTGSLTVEGPRSVAFLRTLAAGLASAAGASK
jgi:sugar phosphate isomerase/epimerase